MKTELQKFGLTDEEANVYLACLEINGGPVSVIARKAGVHRVSCYHTLENLLKLRLVTEYNRNGVKHFAAEPPEKLEQLAQERVTLARTMLPQLKSLMSGGGFRPRIRFYEGMDGIERVFNESLTAKHEILGYTNLEQVMSEIPDFFQSYTKKRFAKGIKSRYLSPNTVDSVQAIIPLLPTDYDPNLLEILLVNKDQFPFSNELLIFDDSVGIVSLDPNEQLGLIVESATFAQTMTAVFDLAWLGATAFVAK